jgi:TatD DNase family protein
LDSPDSARIVFWAEASGTVLFACAVDSKSSKGVARLAAQRPEVIKPFVGVHPSEAKKSRNIAWLRKAVAEASGVGEIGLDPTYSPIGERSDQLDVFRRQLEVSEKRRKPVQVHSRKAESACLGVLSTFKLDSVLMHWLEDETALPSAMERGYYVSFSPALIYSKRLQRMAQKSDPSRVLVESDSPVGFSPLGGVHGPSLVPSVAFKLSELWGGKFDDVLHSTAENAIRYLTSSKKG